MLLILVRINLIELPKPEHFLKKNEKQLSKEQMKSENIIEEQQTTIWGFVRVSGDEVPRETVIIRYQTISWIVKRNWNYLGNLIVERLIK